MWSIAMPRTPKNLADRMAARRRQGEADDGFARETFTQPRDQSDGESVLGSMASRGLHDCGRILAGAARGRDRVHDEAAEELIEVCAAQSERPREIPTRTQPKDRRARRRRGFHRRAPGDGRSAKPSEGIIPCAWKVLLDCRSQTVVAEHQKGPLVAVTAGLSGTGSGMLADQPFRPCRRADVVSKKPAGEVPPAGQVTGSATDGLLTRPGAKSRVRR